MKKKNGQTDSFGAKIRVLREKKGLSLEDLSYLTGYSIDEIKNVENDTAVPPVSLVLQLSHALKIDMDKLTEQNKETSKKLAKSYKKRADSYAYTALIQPGADKHLGAYLVTIEPNTAHKGVEYHHEGEEFVYVLNGSLTIKVGQKISHLKKGQSIHFNSALHHQLSNPSKETAELLVVIYLP
jgi:uncharacterized cupin superfamily protein/lambda repressor-like predicted transcriptional regulator